MAHIAAGRYKAQHQSHQFGFSKNGTKQICVQFKILDDEESAGRTILWYGLFSEAKCGKMTQWERSVLSIQYMGMVGDDLKNPGPLETAVEIEVEENEWEGKTSSRVSWVNRWGSQKISLKAPMSEQDVEQFAAAMQSRIADMARSNGAIDQDKIPF